MFRQAAFGKTVCAVGGFMLLAPVLVYAAIFALGESGIPAGGSGPPVVVDFAWVWQIVKTPGSANITGNVNHTLARVRRERTGWPDETVWDIPGATIPSSGSFETWNDSWNQSQSGVMHYGNKYHWDWQAWNANASDGSSGSRSGGQSGSYNCNQ